MQERLGRYRIVKPLATGGVAEVFLGRLDGPGGFTRPVVVKRLREAYRREPSYRRALVAEARVGALLDHPGILQYLDLVEDGSEIFVVTEYLHGVTARGLIHSFAESGEQSRVPAGLHVTGEVLDALHYAHTATDERGTPLQLVHRDVSPENVFLCLNGSIKLMDFGIARTSISPRDTRVHVIKGKARYCSPEQAQGKQVGVATDVYAAGLLLFELLTGVPALGAEGSDRDVVERARLGRVESIRHLRPDLSSEIVSVLDTALAPDPDDRFPTAREMQRAVRIALHAVGPGYGAADIRALLAKRFSTRLDSQRREIWSDQKTQIAGANASVSAEQQALDRRADAPERRRRRATVTAGERPAVAMEQPQARFSPLTSHHDEAAAAHLFDGEPTQPVLSQLIEAIEREDEASAGAASQVDLEGLRRAITEAYDD